LILAFAAPIEQGITLFFLDDGKQQHRQIRYDKFYN
jgi:hypothetical protein